MLFDGGGPPVKRASLSSGLALCVTVTLAIFLTTWTWKGKARDPLLACNLS